MGLAPGHVSLLVPGLLGPGGRAGAAVDGTLDALLEGAGLSALEQLLRRGRRIASPAATRLDQLFFEHVGLECNDHGDWPLAAFARLEDGERAGDAGEGAWLRADPVHLRPDLGKLLLFDGRSLELEIDEARDLAACINAPAQRSLPCAVEVVSATRWYLRVQRAPGFSSVAPSLAHGTDAARCMPRGPDAMAWHRHMNEVQMLLHEAPVNRAREAAGRAPVNSVWFWGAGSLPARRPLLAGVQVLASRRWARGAARWLGGSAGAPGERYPGRPGPGAAASSLCCLDLFAGEGPRNDPLAWREALCELDDAWLAPLLRALQAGAIAGLQLHAGGGLGLELLRRDLRRWLPSLPWRRRPLATLIEAVASDGAAPAPGTRP